MASKFQTITELHGSTAKAVTATPSSWRTFFHHFPSGVPHPPGTLSSSSLSFSFSFSSLVSSAKRWGFSRGFCPRPRAFPLSSWQQALCCSNVIASVPNNFLSLFSLSSCCLFSCTVCKIAEIVFFALRESACESVHAELSDWCTSGRPSCSPAPAQRSCQCRRKAPRCYPCGIPCFPPSGKWP